MSLRKKTLWSTETPHKGFRQICRWLGPGPTSAGFARQGCRQSGGIAKEPAARRYLRPARNETAPSRSRRQVRLILTVIEVVPDQKCGREEDDGKENPVEHLRHGELPSFRGIRNPGIPYAQTCDLTFTSNLSGRPWRSRGWSGSLLTPPTSRHTALRPAGRQPLRQLRRHRRGRHRSLLAYHGVLTLKSSRVARCVRPKRGRSRELQKLG